MIRKSELNIEIWVMLDNAYFQDSPNPFEAARDLVIEQVKKMTPDEDGFVRKPVIDGNGNSVGYIEINLE